ncbi:MAG: hypothetical protein A2029_08495 [Chloroflexi bacterium RBG_19FT_COMBO_47_9]|nr:MAG: hypothetical protein A2029_08495 [Chloroflexi bacterium RBG_19FT_COMBO_47_9]
MADQFKWAVSALATRTVLPQFFADNLPIVEIVDSTTITADQLRWFRDSTSGIFNYGDPISTQSFDQHTAGILYWEGRVGALINLPEDGWYLVSVRAQHTPPAPVILQLEADLQPFGKLELQRSDLSWEVFPFKVYLEKGVHLLDVNYLNNEIVNEIDRNAVIEWINLEEAR